MRWKTRPFKALYQSLFMAMNTILKVDDNFKFRMIPEKQLNIEELLSGLATFILL